MPVETKAPPLMETKLPGVPLWRRGKVRDVYDLGDELLVVATDRLSAFDVVLPTGIPGKGILLTQMSLFWFDLLKDVVPHHVLSADVAEYPAELRPLRATSSRAARCWSSRPTCCRSSASCAATSPARASRTTSGPAASAASRFPRGCASRIAWSRRSSRRRRRRRRATTRTSRTRRWSRRVGRERAAEARRVSLELYERARAHAEARGIILADTKFEFGVRDGRLIWIDEALTPDSSRFWPRDALRAGPVAAQLRQAVRARLPRDPRLGQAAAGPRAPSGSRRAHRGEVRGGIRSPPGGGPLESAAFRARSDPGAYRELVS